MPLRRLTPRQSEIADLICLHGLSVVAISRKLDMPIATARRHVADIGRRLANPHGLPAYRLIQSYAPAVREGARLAADAQQPGRIVTGKLAS